MKGLTEQIVGALAADGTLDAALLAEDATAPIDLSAQAHLERFDASLGFRAFGTPYDEDGIAHIVWIPAKDEMQIWRRLSRYDEV